MLLTSTGEEVSTQLINDIIEIEGGYVNHPDDLGKATNYGITLATYRRVVDRKADAVEIKEMSRAQAREIYLTEYYTKMQLDEIKCMRLRWVLLNLGVHRGTRAIVKELQRQINKYHMIDQLLVDGDLGPKTLDAANEPVIQYNNIPEEMVYETQIHYVKIVRRRPEQIVFLLGWMRRTHNLLGDI